MVLLCISFFLASLAAVDGKPAGIVNLGNTCFFNAAMQVLYAAEPLRNALLAATPQFKEKTPAYGAGIWMARFSSLAQEQHYFEAEKEFLGSCVLAPLGFKLTKQEDASEFLGKLLENCVTQVPEMGRVFQGEIIDVKKCVRKAPERTIPEIDTNPFNLLLVNLYEDASTLESCLERSYGKSEEVSGVASCSTGVRYEKSLFLGKLSEVLIISLNRFFTGEKISWPVVFPVHNLDLSPYMLSAATTQKEREEARYDLQGFVIHHGYGMTGGHYTAYVRYGNNWFNANDETVQPATEKQVEEVINNNQRNAYATPYVLVYVRRPQQTVVEKPVPGKEDQALTNLFEQLLLLAAA